MSLRHAHRASILHFIDSPANKGAGACVFFDDGLLIVDEGIVVEVGDAATLLPRYRDIPITEHTDKWLTPGFIDTHTHFCQTDIIASDAPDLLQWLNRYTFPIEATLADESIAADTAAFFIKKMLSSGTTSAAVFSTTHRHATDALFAQAERHRLRLIGGKVMMDRHVPADLLETVEAGIADSTALIRRWHGRGRLQYAITPRFAPTSTPAQLAATGALFREYPDTLLQTHMNENLGEIKWVRELFPDSPDYFSVYEKYGLAGERCLFGHCIHMSDDEWRRFADSGSVITHCPTSNLFLGSGLFDFARARTLGIRVGLASDIGGGNSFSLFRVMEEAYKIAQLRGDHLDALHLWYHATLGGAAALGIDAYIGNFTTGKEADFIIIDPSKNPLLQRRLSRCDDLNEKLFALAMMGDESIIDAAFILGERVE